MSKEVREYVEEKIIRDVWDATFRSEEEKPNYTKQTQFLACINPENLEIIKIFESITEMEHNTGSINLQPILNKYFKGLYKRPTICEYIVVPFYRKDLRHSIPEFREVISERAIDRVLNMRLQQIEGKIYNKSHEAKKAYYEIFNTILKTYTNKTKYEIKL